MLRTQIQITDTQSDEIRQLADRLHVSIAEVIRRGIDAFLRSQPREDRLVRVERVLALADRFRSPSSDGSAHHDAHLAEAYQA